MNLTHRFLLWPPSVHLRAPGGAEAWLMTWPLHGPRMTSSWGSRHLARRNSQRDVKVLPSEAHRGLRGVPLHSMLHSLSWSTLKNCRGEKKWGDKQWKHFLNQTFFFWERASSAPKHFNITQQQVWFWRDLWGRVVEVVWRPKQAVKPKNESQNRCPLPKQYNFLNLFQRFYHNQVEHPFRHTDKQYNTQSQGSVTSSLSGCSQALSLSEGLEKTWLTLPLFFVRANTCMGIHLESLLRMFYSAMKRETRTETPGWTHQITCVNATIVSATVVWNPLARPHNGAAVVAARGAGNKLWLLQWMKTVNDRVAE